jgi:hypothetical protein
MHGAGNTEKHSLKHGIIDFTAGSLGKSHVFAGGSDSRQIFFYFLSNFLLR